MFLHESSAVSEANTTETTNSDFEKFLQNSAKPYQTFYEENCENCHLIEYIVQLVLKVCL